MGSSWIILGEWLINYKLYMGVSLVMGVPPIAGFFIRENPDRKWMIWGYPYFRKPSHGGFLDIQKTTGR